MTDYDGADLGYCFLEVFGPSELRKLAGNDAFGAGMEYAFEGRVGARRVSAGRVRAKVQGSASYQVELTAGDADREPTYGCSCPVGEAGPFCKHAVAVALMAIGAVPEPDEADDHEPGSADQFDEDDDDDYEFDDDDLFDDDDFDDDFNDDEDEDEDEIDSAAPGPVDIRSYLNGLDHHVLVDLLIECAANDDSLATRLRLGAARAAGAPVQIAQFRNMLDDAMWVDHYVHYRDMADYASNIDSVVDSLEDLIEAGHADEAMELALYGLDRAERALGHVDDSDGWLGGVVERLGGLHLTAVMAAQPDPITLARALFARELDDDSHGTFYGAAGHYAEALGAEGLAEYRRLAAPRWEALPPLGVKDKRAGFSSERGTITRIMETLAKANGDADELIAVLAHDLSSARQFTRIVGVLVDAGRTEEALEWAERGVDGHGREGTGLVDAAADLYHRLGQGERAVQLTFDALVERPSLNSYERLAGNAARTGEWEKWHPKAIAALRADLRKRSKSSAFGTNSWGADGSTLVSVLLFDGNVDAAWEMANGFGCSANLWTELAHLREEGHPEDAIVIWQREAQALIQRKDNGSYAAAVERMERVRRLMAAAGRPDDFWPYLEQVRQEHKPKRNLMKLLKERGWLG